MSDETADYLTTVLDRCEAMIDCGAAKLVELAEFVCPDKPTGEAITRASEWVRRRVKRPNGETALRLHKWAEVKTLEISKGGKAIGEAYAKAFAEIQNRRKQRGEH